MYTIHTQKRSAWGTYPGLPLRGTIICKSVIVRSGYQNVSDMARVLISWFGSLGSVPASKRIFGTRSVCPSSKASGTELSGVGGASPVREAV
jgi:hypothetical protein